jgi:transcriptional regulator with XRE-family HTH domain
MPGKRIKRIRTEKGLNLSELARRAGISKSMMSQIENDLSNPSIDTIRSIATVLEEPVFAFFLEEGEPLSTILRKEERLRFKRAGSDVEREFLTHDFNRAMAMLRYCLPPGSRSAPAPGSHRGEECILVLKGELTVHLQDRTHTLAIGDTIYYDSRLPHMFSNQTDKDAEILMVCSPPVLRPDHPGF